MSPRSTTLTGLATAALLVGMASYAYRRGERGADMATVDTARSAMRRDSGAAPVAGETPKSEAPPLRDTIIRKPAPSPDPTSLVRPHLIRAIPNSAVLTMGAAIEVELRGTGFTATGNAILFGTLNGGTVSSANGTSIRFIVPTEFPAHGEVPPMAVQPGAYPIFVRNRNGVSDTVTFTLRSGAP